MIRTVFIGSVVLSLAMSVAYGAPRETTTFTNVPSQGLDGRPTNAVRTATFTGGYSLGRVILTGTLRSDTSATWPYDACIEVAPPGAAPIVVHPFSQQSSFTNVNANFTAYLPPTTVVPGFWRFRFYESMSTLGSAASDATWTTLTITLDDAPPAAPVGAIDMGTLTLAGASHGPDTIAAQQLRWYHFRVGRSVSAASGRFLDIDVTGTGMSFSPFQNDTHTAVYDSRGVLIASDDNAGPGAAAMLTFGAGTRPASGDGFAYDGFNGPLAAGDYFLAAGAYQCNFRPLGFVASALSDITGAITVTVRTNASACIADVAQLGGTLGPDGQATADDLVAFLAAFFAGEAAISDVASLGGVPIADGLITPDDIIAFLSAFFAGCP